MEQFFTSLNKRQTMLLLTAATFGGQESIGIFDHLPDDEAELLKHRAEGIAKIPRERRVPLLVQEIKRLVTARRGQLWSADPERLAQVLKGERAALVEVILRALPQNTADAVRKHLPKLEPVKLQHEVRPQILHIVRWKLEEALVRAAPRRAGFKFSDVLLLKSREVLTLCDRLGGRALAQAIAGLGEGDRDTFFAKLKPDQRQLAARHATAAAARALTEPDAKQLLSLYGAEKDPSLAVTSAGAQRLARAALAQSPEFAARLVERHPGPLGQLLLKWIREERPRVTGKIDGGRTDVVGELEQLEQQGIIDKPIRLAPPPSKSAPPPRPSGGPAELPGGKLLPPRPRGLMPPPPGAPASGPYRDPIAERQARRAGALSSRVPPPEPQGAPRPDRSPSRAMPPAPERVSRPSSRSNPVPPDRSGRPPSRSMPAAPDGQRPERPPIHVMPVVPEGHRRDRPSGRDLPPAASESHRADRASGRDFPPASSEARRSDRHSGRDLPPASSEAHDADRHPRRDLPPESQDAERADRPSPPARQRPRSQVLQPIPKRPAPRAPSAPAVPEAEPGKPHSREHRAVGYDTAKRRSEQEEREGDPPTSPRNRPDPQAGGHKNDRTSLQRAPRPPGRGPKGRSG